LLAADGVALLSEADAMRARSIAFSAALDELASLFHRIAIAQAVPDATDAMDDAPVIASYATRMTAETVQLAYQICVQGRADLALAPDEATGFTMTLLRLLAFEPAQGGAAAIAGGRSRQSASSPATTEATRLAVAEPAAVTLPVAAIATMPPSATQPVSMRIEEAAPDIVAPASGRTRSLPIKSAEWPAFVASLKLGGIVGQLAAQTELIRCDGQELVLALPEAQRHLTDKPYVDKLKTALDEAFGGKLRLTFELCSGVDASLAAQDKRERDERKAQTGAAFRDEPFVREVLARFDAKIRPGSIKPIS